jgi:hypothetical protein
MLVKTPYELHNVFKPLVKPLVEGCGGERQGPKGKNGPHERRGLVRTAPMINPPLGSE